MRVLFVCNQNRHRSKTAEVVFRDRFDVKSAGLYNERPVSANELEWADTVAVMEEEQRIELAKRFPEQFLLKKVVCLNVPDTFSFGDPDLVSIFQRKVDEL